MTGSWTFTLTHLIAIIQAFVAASVIALGWYIGNYLASNRDIENRRDQLRTAYVVSAYEVLATSSNREITPQIAEAMSLAVAKIQLYGNDEELASLDQFFKTWDKPQPDGRPRGDMNALLKALRKSLRKSLFNDARPETADRDIRWFRPLGGLN